MNYAQKIKIVETWISNAGLILNWSNSHNYDIETNVINVCKKGSKRNVLYTLLHETAHAIQYNSKWHKQWGKIPERDSLVKMIHDIREEIDAWDKGYKLAKRLNLEVDQEDYEKFASKHISSYIYYWNDRMKPKTKSI